jgi:phosphatidylinositol alpha-mannosyltransferase
MRIALVHPFSWPEVRRGGERYLADLAWYLATAGHDVDVITGTRGSAATTRTGVVTERRLRHRAPAALARRGAGDEEVFGALALGHLLRRRYDVVHAFTPTAAIAARAARQRTVYTVLGHPEPGLVEHRPRLARVFRLAARRATLTVALSRASADATRDVLGRRAEVLPPGVRLEDFPPSAAPRTGPPTVLFASDAGDRRKRVDLALVAVGRLLDRRPDARLVLAGAGDHRWALPALGADEERVTAATDARGAGDLADVPSLYRRATVTVLPAEGEAFGLVLVESLASGTPAVCVDLGGPPEIVDSPSVGRVVPPGDADALAAALGEAIDLAADPSTPARCAAHARRWDWLASVGPMHEDAYASIVRRPRRGRA